MGPGAILSKNSSSGSQNLYIAPQVKKDLSTMHQPEHGELMGALQRLGILNTNQDSNMSLRDEDDQTEYSMPDQSQLYTEPQGQPIGF